MTFYQRRPGDRRSRWTRTSRRALSAAVALLLLCGCGDDATRPRAVGLHVVGCGAGAGTGSGLLVAPDVVLTSAHVVAGAETITILVDGDTEAAATVVGFDPWMDLAYLHAPVEAAADIVEPAISGDGVEPGTEGRALVFRDGAPTELEVEIRRRVRINTEDIYVEGETTRPGFELRAEIELGDSGGAVWADGRVVGVLWARSRGDGERAYAIDVSRARTLIDGQLAAGDLGPDVDPARCG